MLRLGLWASFQRRLAAHSQPLIPFCPIGLLRQRPVWRSDSRQVYDCDLEIATLLQVPVMACGPCVKRVGPCCAAMGASRVHKDDRVERKDAASSEPHGNGLLSRCASGQRVSFARLVVELKVALT